MNMMTLLQLIWIFILYIYFLVFPSHRISETTHAEASVPRLSTYGSRSPWIRSGPFTHVTACKGSSKREAAKVDCAVQERSAVHRANVKCSALPQSNLDIDSASHFVREWIKVVASCVQRPYIYNFYIYLIYSICNLFLWSVETSRGRSS